MTAVQSAQQIEAIQVVRAMELELRVLTDLSAALAAQRDGIAADDPEALEAATHAVSRTIFTLDEARRRREWLARLAGDGSGDMHALQSMVGEIPGLDETRIALRRAAQDVTRGLQLNQMILKRALRSGERYLQGLFSSLGAPADGPAGQVGVLMNRSA